MTPDLLPLQTNWVMYSSGGKGHSWEMKRIVEVASVSDFMTFVNHTKAVSSFAGSVELAMFRSGVTPDWAVDPCKSGGRWTVRVERVSDIQLDSIWLEVLLVLIGGTFTSDSSLNLEESVVGIAYSSRPGSVGRKLSLWTSVRDEESVMLIGEKFRDVLQAILPGKDLGEISFQDFLADNKYAYGIGKKKGIPSTKTNPSRRS